MTGTAGPQTLPTAWAVLARALSKRRAVRARYHGRDRVLCPHLLGWKHARPTVLALQVGGDTRSGALPADPRQRWRSLFVDEIDSLVITDDPWATADNYSLHRNCIDTLVMSVALK